VVAHHLSTTVVTLGHVTAEQGSSAGFDIVHHAQLTTRQMMGLPVDLAMSTKDIGDFEPFPCPVPDVSSGTHGLLPWVRIIVETVKWRAGIPHMVSRQFEISQGGLDTVVA
jgi:hypothetical protein